MTREPFEFQPMVDKGCKLLDERLGPEWVNKIDLRTLALQSDCSCVLGQLAIDLGGGAHSFGAVAPRLFSSPLLFKWESDAIEHGFILPADENPKDYEPLTKCWTRTIAARRAES